AIERCTSRATAPVITCTRSTSIGQSSICSAASTRRIHGSNSLSQSSWLVTGGFAPFTAVIRTSPSPSRGARPPCGGPCCGRRCRAGSGTRPGREDVHQAGEGPDPEQQQRREHVQLEEQRRGGHQRGVRPQGPE